jgi:anti-sigma factor RsiW
MNEPDHDDLRLVAFLDGEISEAEAAELERRLAADPSLRRRLDELRSVESPLRDAFAALLQHAPKPRLRASLDRVAAPPIARDKNYPRRWAAAAVFALLLFGAGFGAARYTARAPSTDVASSETWRQAIAEYMDLYTSETFGAAEATISDREFATLGQRVGVALDKQSLSLAGLSLRGAELLQFHGAPLLQIGYVDDATPVAFCILRGNEIDAPLTPVSLEGFAAASWAKDGRSFMVIGKLPQDRIVALAQTLRDRI